MAKRIVKWSLDGIILKISKHLEDPKATAEILAEFSLDKLFPTISEMNDVQRQLVVFGTKQKLMDTGANEVADPDGKVTSAKKKWNELLEGKWAGERVNSTGAAENKVLVGKVKDLKTVVSLEGLTVKKVLYPDQFTEDDQAKLDEFIKLAARAQKGK